MRTRLTFCFRNILLSEQQTKWNLNWESIKILASSIFNPNLKSDLPHDLFYENFVDSFQNTFKSLVVPLWLFFWITDYLYSNCTTQFLTWAALRGLVGLIWFKSASLLKIRWLTNNAYLFVLLAMLSGTWSINYMIISAGDSYCSPYLIGLLLTIFGAQMLLSFPTRYFCVFVFLSLVPVGFFYLANDSWVTAAEIFGSIAVAILLARFSLLTPDGQFKNTKNLKLTINNQKKIVENEIQRRVDVASRNASAQVIAETAQYLAHDLQTPFNMLQLIAAQIANKNLPNEKILEFLEELQKSHNYARELVADLLHAGGSFNLQKKKTRLSQLVEESFLLCNANAHQSRTLKNGIPDDIIINVDPKYMKRVFINLFSNALNATKEINKACFWSKISSKPDCFIIEIGNSHTYLEPDECKQIFVQFHSHSKESGHSGLGLSIAFEIIRRHNGQITCKSDRTTGTVFEITLPSLVNQGDNEDCNSSGVL